MSTTTGVEANERLALLLGWERAEWVSQPDGTTVDGWLHYGRSLGRPETAPPDYTTWDRFPELQAYVRGLGYRQRVAITDQMRWPSTGIRYSWWDITPEILGNAILEVCDE